MVHIVFEQATKLTIPEFTVFVEELVKKQEFSALTPPQLGDQEITFDCHNDEMTAHLSVFWGTGDIEIRRGLKNNNQTLQNIIDYLKRHGPQVVVRVLSGNRYV